MFLRMIESTFVSQVPEGLFGEFLANCCYPHMDWPRAHYHSLHRLLRHVLLPGLAFEWRRAGAAWHFAVLARQKLSWRGACL